MSESNFEWSQNPMGGWRFFVRLLASGLCCALVAAGFGMWISLNEDSNSVAIYNEPNFETACLMLIMGAPIIIAWQLLPVALMAGSGMASALRSGCVELKAVLLTAPFATLLAWIPKAAGLEIESDYMQLLALECAGGFGIWGAAQYFAWRQPARSDAFGSDTTASF